MSSTARGGKRSPADRYWTPQWAVTRFLEKTNLPSGPWLEPGAGVGSIIRATNEFREDVDWYAVELEESYRDPLVEVTGSSSHVEIADMLDPNFKLPAHWPKRFKVALGNPPYRLAMEFIEFSLQHADIVAMLLRLNFLGSEERNEWMKQCPPDLLTLPNRPSFRGQGSDSIEYSWMLWEQGKKPRTYGLHRVLDTTPLAIRKAQKPKYEPETEELPSEEPPHNSSANEQYVNEEG